MNTATPSPKAGAVAGYLLCIALIPLYVNMFPVWKYLSTRFGDTMFVVLPPVLLFLFLGLSFIFHLKSKNSLQPIDKASITLGLLLCCIGLLSTDPEFPVKRVHVAEYAFLCLVARYAMSHFLDGRALFFFSACLATILGIHDEFLQGIHPARTYGLRDMGVNLLGSFGGGLIWHGLQLFSDRKGPALSRVDGCFICWLCIAALLLIWPALWYRGLVIQTWAVLPLLAALVYYFFYRDRFTGALRHGITVLGAATVSLAVYPLLTRLPGIVFY